MGGYFTGNGASHGWGVRGPEARKHPPAPKPKARYVPKGPNGAQEPKGRSTGTGHAGLLHPSERKSPRPPHRPDRPSSEGAPRHLGPGVPPGKGRGIPGPVPPHPKADQKEWLRYKAELWADKQARSKPKGKAFADMRTRAEENARNKPPAPKPSKAELLGDTVKMKHGTWRPGEDPRVTWVRNALRKGGENAQTDRHRRGQRLFDAPKKGGLYQARKTVEAVARPELATKEARKLREFRDRGVEVVRVRPSKPQSNEETLRNQREAHARHQEVIDKGAEHASHVASDGLGKTEDHPRGHGYDVESQHREKQLWTPKDRQAVRRSNQLDETPWEDQGPTDSEKAHRNIAQHRANGRKGTGPMGAQQFRKRIQEELEARKSVPKPSTKPPTVASKTLPRLGGGLGALGMILQLLAGGDPLEAAGFDVERAGETGGSKAAWIRRNPKLLAGAKDAERRYAVAQAKRQAANDHYWRGK